MKYKPIVVIILLMLTTLLISGCNLDWLGELITNLPGESTSDPMKGMFLEAQHFQVSPDENRITLQGLAAGERVVMAISPWNPATMGVYYDLRVSLERIEPLALNMVAETDPVLLAGTAQFGGALAPEAGAGTKLLSEGLTAEAGVSAGSSNDYYSYSGDLAGLNTRPLEEGGVTLQSEADRTFYVKTNESYTQVQAILLREGLHIVVYADDAVQVETSALEELVETFDFSIYAKVTQTFGYPWDKDSNGKVILLITPLRYDGSDTKLIGYFDEVNLFDRVEENYSNEADMFYLNANVLSGDTNLVYGNLAHEFQHLIFAGAKLQAWRDHPGGSRFVLGYSDIWINEGLSMLAAHLTGYVNLASDPRIFDSAYGYFARPHLDGLLSWDQSRPESNYGSAGLFAYYIYDHYKSAIKMILTEETKAEETIALYAVKDFPAIFRNWVIANMADRMSNVNDWRYYYRSLDLKGGPAYKVLQGEDYLGIWSTGVQYYLVEGDGSDLQFTFEPGGPNNAQFSLLNGVLIFFKPVTY